MALNGQGKTRGAVAILKVRATCNQSLVAMEIKDKQIIDYRYLYYYLKNMYQEIRDITGSESRSGLNIPLIKNIQIYLPDIRTQEQIVEQLEIERKMIESQKEVIQLFQSKLENKINSLWII
jgi:restriction endonuclease S subunit